MNAPVCISNFINTPTEHQDVLNLPRSSDEVAHIALECMREMLHCSGPASRWRRLSLSARQMICFGAKLRPSSYAHRDLDEMTPDEREAIRRSIQSLQSAMAEFADGLMTRRDWLMIPNRQALAEQERQRETARRIELDRQHRDLTARFNAIQTQG